MLQCQDGSTKSTLCAEFVQQAHTLRALRAVRVLLQRLRKYYARGYILDGGAAVGPIQEELAQDREVASRN